MRVRLPYGQTTLAAEIGGNVEVITTRRVETQHAPAQAVRAGLERPIGADPLVDQIQRRRAKTACILVSDATRPVPNETLLAPILTHLQTAGIHPDRITILVATGLHRPTTRDEKRLILGPEIPNRFTVLDHDPTDRSALARLPGKTPAGSTVYVNRAYLEADIKIATGRIDPHFMLGYSGGRKSICPGIVDLRTVQHLHGPAFLGDPNAKAGVLEGNPCHAEALAVARMVGTDLIVNVTALEDQRIVGVYVGDLEAAHLAGVRELADRIRLEVFAPADIVVTSAGGAPRDATFYQSVKGFLAPLDIVRPGGAVICCAACSEGIGSESYQALMRRYDGRFRKFLKDIRARKSVQLDQWEYQMHARVLDKIGLEGLTCVTDGIDREALGHLSVSLPAGEGRSMLQETVDTVATRFENPHTVVVPEGPCCIPVLASE